MKVNCPRCGAPHPRAEVCRDLREQYLTERLAAEGTDTPRARLTKALTWVQRRVLLNRIGRAKLRLGILQGPGTGPKIFGYLTGQPVTWGPTCRSTPRCSRDNHTWPELEWGDLQNWTREPMSDAMAMAVRGQHNRPKGSRLRALGPRLLDGEDSEVGQAERHHRWAKDNGWLFEPAPTGETTADYLARGGVIRRFGVDGEALPM